MPIKRSTIAVTVSSVIFLGNGKYRIQVSLICNNDNDDEVINRDDLSVDYISKTGRNPADSIAKIRTEINKIIEKWDNEEAFSNKAALSTAIDNLQTQIRTD